MSNFTLCGYSNCFRPFYKIRGFMPCCKRHYLHPQKWCNHNPKTKHCPQDSFTGSTFIKKPLAENSKGGDALTSHK